MSDDLPIQSSSTGLVNRAKSILLKPTAEWQQIAGETTEPTKVLTGYALPLAAIGPVATLIGSLVFGYQFLGITVRPGVGTALGTAVLTFVLSLVSLYVVALIANFLSPKFGGKESFPAAFRLVAYSMTAAWVAGIFGLIPALSILSIVGFYSLYLFYLGAGPVMGVPQDKTIGFTVVTVIAAIVLNIVVGVIVAAIIGTSGMAAGGLATNDAAQVNLGELGAISVDGDNQTIDLGELGRVEVDGDTATVTVGGEQIQMRVNQPE